jgi:hypothetical protein
MNSSHYSLRSAVSGRFFIDDRNLSRQTRQATTHLIPRSVGRLGLMAIAQSLWVGSLASQWHVVPRGVSLTGAITPPSAIREEQWREDYFDEILDPVPVDHQTFRSIRRLLTAPYVWQDDFPPPFEP